MTPFRITRAKFDALCVVRRVGTELLAPEVEWWSIDSDRLLGVVSHDLSDDTWVWLVLGRDQHGLFRAIDLEHSIVTQESASKGLQSALGKTAAGGQSVFPQEDAREQGNACNLLTPCVPDARQFPHFKTLIGSREYSPASALLREYCPVFIDIDGNFVEQFQSTAFNARLWELYLDRMLREQGFHRVTDFDRPDYCVMKHGVPLAIEAVTVNPSATHPLPSANDADESKRILSDFMPLRFSGPLMAKLGKRYWELPHMNGVPIVIAIHDYYTEESMTWSLGSLTQYLYGLRGTGFLRHDGIVDAKFQPIEEHVWGSKKLPSGFFQQPGAEYISAVLANSAASLSKFNRMGKEAGLGDPAVHMHRIGHRWNPDPKAAIPLTFDYEVTSSQPREKWSDELVLYINPDAKHPVPEHLLHVGAVHTVADGRIVSYLRDDYIMSSRTLISVAPSME